jgi:predicted ester cyclase
MPARADLEAFYRRYNALCNDHDFDRLGEFVAEEVTVDGEPRGLAAYGSAFGVPATGRRVSTQEFAFYRIQGGRIVEVWVTADNLRILDQLRD